MCRHEHQHADELPSGSRPQCQLLPAAVIVRGESTVFFPEPKPPLGAAGTFEIKSQVVISQNTKG